MGADGGNDFVRRRVFFRIEDYIDVLQMLRRKIVGKFLAKDDDDEKDMCVGFNISRIFERRVFGG